MTQTNGTSRISNGRNGAASHYVTVDVPHAYDGVGRALRRSYKVKADIVPADMAALLDRLDGI